MSGKDAITPATTVATTIIVKTFESRMPLSRLQSNRLT
jgi:hypothetical protein